MILLYDNNMASIPESAVWRICLKQFEAYRWSLVLQVDGEVVDEILGSEEFIDANLEEEKALDQIFDLFNRTIHATARVMARANDDSVLNLGQIIRREIERWDREKAYSQR